MNLFFFHTSKNSLAKNILLEKADRKFSKVARKMTSRGKDAKSVWLALGYFHKLLAEDGSATAKKILNDGEAFQEFLDDTERNYTNDRLCEISRDTKEIKEQNENLKEDNAFLRGQLQIVQDQNIRLEEDARKSKRLALGLFALSVVVAFAPIVLKRMGYDLEKPQNPVKRSYQDDFVMDRPLIIIEGNNLYFQNFYGLSGGDDKPKLPGNMNLPELPGPRKSIPQQNIAP